MSKQEPIYVNMTPYEMELSSTQLMPGTDSIKEFHIRVSAPTLKAAKQLADDAVKNVVHLRPQHK